MSEANLLETITAIAITTNFFYFKKAIKMIKLYNWKLKEEKMNYLAHICLSDNSEENMLGNFLGDFVNRSLEDEFKYSIKCGIFMHKKMDTFTDSHPDFLRSRERISKINRRLSGVLIDIFYDHFLAKNWCEYSSISLEEYANNFYKILKKI
ncbi:ACP phosphodiesterase [Clostridium sp. BL-8]|uniref:ACP phosphodiesterase n=1 Tax=Clostridium sp. BL-8 TaxID=349938 RepID=UPI0009C8CC62|nr:ACP phosphodiesterase [Clostridium sp. BL-8]OOM72354.1 acyl carrier protein phosphodiesterase [Clostridium sp. BL-8]